MAKPDGERIASLETSMSNIDRKVDALKAGMDAGFATINARLETLHSDADKRFVTKDEMTTLKDDLNELKNKRWVHNTLSAILGAVLTSLIGVVVYFVTKG